MQVQIGTRIAGRHLCSIWSGRPHSESEEGTKGRPIPNRAAETETAFPFAA